MNELSILGSLFKFIGTDDPTQFDLNAVVKAISLLRGILIGAAAAEAVIALILVGYNYFTAFGDESKAETAKKRIKWVIVGLIVILLSEVLIYEVTRFFAPALQYQPPPIDDTLNPFNTGTRP